MVAAMYVLSWMKSAFIIIYHHSLLFMINAIFGFLITKFTLRGAVPRSTSSSTTLEFCSSTSDFRLPASTPPPSTLSPVGRRGGRKNLRPHRPPVGLSNPRQPNPRLELARRSSRPARVRLCPAGLVIPLRHVNILEFSIEIETDTLSSSHQQTMMTIERRPVLAGPTMNFYANSRLDEMLVLGHWFRKNIFRARELFEARAVQAAVVGCALGTVYMNAWEKNSGVLLETRLGFFTFTLSYLLTSSTEALPIFLRERKVLEREVSSGAVPVYWLVGLRRDVDGFVYFALVVGAVVMASNSFTACFSMLVPDFIVGSSVIAGLMGSFFPVLGVFCGEGGYAEVLGCDALFEPFQVPVREHGDE
ncbi:ABC transporter family protein [Striga asiatica]|uniref:ABC transporter family protein n=1 Tax=Striga asiatica TaxID=4170 RepID=A0A5A7QXP8_STRAF|nr:ABC transporter family protein [Striga asiatica]